MKKHIVFDCDGTLIDTNKVKYELFPGIKELLNLLAKDSVLYVWTARDRRSTLRILTELGVINQFEAICTLDDAMAKPHVSGLMELVGGVSKEQICVIGDSSNDILGAKNFGVKSIAAVWNPGSNAEVMRVFGADFIASEPLSCFEWLSLNLKST